MKPKLRLFRIPLVFIISATSVIYSQNKAVAKFNDIVITSEEYLKRFELTPRVRSSANSDLQKLHFLYTLIAEKLWAEEAIRQGLDTLQSFKKYVLNLEKMLVRDALFKKEVESKINISQDELNEALGKRRYKLRLNFLFSESKQEIDSLYNELKTISIDSLLVNRTELAEQTEPVQVVFGQMNKSLEDSLFQLNIGEYTKPIYNEIGWVIYYLRDRFEKTAPELGNYQTALSEIRELITNRKKQSAMNEYLGELLANVNVNADGQLFRFLSDKLYEIISQKSFADETKVYFLYENDLTKLIESIPADLKNKIFIKFKRDPVSLIDFVYYLYFNNFQLLSTDKESVRMALNGVVREFIRYEIISREGYKQKLDTLPEVENELEMWKSNFLSQYLRNTYINKAIVTDRELENFISAQHDSTITTKFVSVTEIRLDNLDKVQFIFSQMHLGYKFGEVLQSLNLPESSIIISDTLKPISTFGSLSEIIEGMEKGEVYGPVIRATGYSILKLNDVEEKNLTATQKNQLQIDTQREILFYKKLKNLLTEKTIKLAKQSNLQINEDILNQIKVTEIPALIYKYYGFGGQTVAAPFMNLFYEWFYKYQNQKEEAL